MAVDKKNLSPLPLGVSERTQPLNAAPTSTPDLAPSAPAEKDFRDPVDQWVEDNPKFDEVNPGQVPSAPPAEAPATTQAPTQPPTPAPDAPSTPPATPQVPPTETPAQPPAAPQPQPSAKHYAPDEKIALAEGVEWERGQIVEALKERARLEPVAKEAETYTKLFGMPAEQAAQNWGPVLQRLASEPNTVAFLDGYLSNPDKAEYLERCAQFFDTEAPVAQPQQPQQSQPQQVADPVLAREVAQLREWKDAQDKQAATDRVNREFAQAISKYPFIATDENLRRDLILTAQALHAQDQSKGLLDALALKASIYDALGIARGATPAPVVPTEPQPALLGSPGASPGGSRPTNNGRTKSFEDTNDALEDWLKNPPSSFQ